MKTLNVPDMHCEMCVKRIDTALKEENISHIINLENKTVEIEKTKINQAKEILEDLGFSSEE